MAYRPQWLIDLAKVAPETAKFAQSQLLKSQNNAYQATTLAKLTNDRLQPNQNASSIVSSLTNFVSNIGTQARSFVSNTATGISQAFDNLPQDLKNGFNDLTKNIREFVDNKIDDAKKGIEYFTKDVNERFKDFSNETQKAINKTGEFFDNGINSVKENISKISEVIVKKINETGKWVSDSVSSAVSKIGKAIENVGKEFSKAIDNTIKTIRDSMNDSLMILSLGFNELTKAFIEVWKFDAEKFVSQQIALQHEIVKRHAEFVKKQ